MKLRGLALGFLFVVAVGLVLFGAQAPQYVHLSWQHDPTTTMTIMWRTDTDVTDSVVEYGPTDNYGMSASGTVETYTYARKEILWHTVELTGLTPNTTYHYRCGAEGNWSDDYYFKTAPEYGPRNMLRIAVFGDSRGGWDTLAQIFQVVKKERVQLIVFTGDFTNGAAQMEYDKFFSAGEGVLEYIPFMPVHGNHEMGLETYFGEFALPGNERYFSYDYGPIHFTYLYSFSEPEAVTQRPWMLQDLRGTTKPWKIIVAHKTIYSAGGGHGITPYLLDHWVDIFDKTGVDIYFNGHDHDYERSWPIKSGRIDADGTVYLTTGGAGAPLVDVGRGWWTAVSESSYHYIMLLVRPTQISMTVKRLDGSVLDSTMFLKNR
ncbi:hypothetical protein DRJ23_05050 [Candidatus Acetothermia bacterium]|nr:MAG: hypothetical protein DRJ23_05050 [Candidatus Acetothermia bacterium]